MGSSFLVICNLLFLLIFGSLSTLTIKWQFSMESIGLQGEWKQFAKPWWGAFVTFAAMSMMSIMYWFQSTAEAERHKSAQCDAKKQALIGRNGDFLANTPEIEWSSFRLFLVVGIPALIDVVATGFSFLGLLFVSASTWQMLRGSIMVFSALLSTLFLKRQLFPIHWLALGMCVIGIICVAVASTFASSVTEVLATQNHQPMGRIEHFGPIPLNSVCDQHYLGVCLILVASALQAIQIVGEECLLIGVQFRGVAIVGFEGLWGVIFMILVFFPIVQLIPGTDAGSVENIFDTLEMLRNNFCIIVTCVVFVISCVSGNIARMLVTQSLTAEHYALSDASKTLFIWLANLCVFYFGPPSLAVYGEVWTSYSYLQFVGFLLLVLGQLIYGQILVLDNIFPVLYPSARDAKNGIKSRGVDWNSFLLSPVSRHAMTPLPPFSPEAHRHEMGDYYSPPPVHVYDVKQVGEISDDNPFKYLIRREISK